MHSSHSSIELLEARIAPATLVNPTTVTYVDSDGDNVVVKISKGSFDLAQNFVFVAAGAGQQLQRVDLAMKTEFQGARLTITSNAAGGGDGFVNVGFVSAFGIDLAGVTVDGDLGRVEAGDGLVKTPGLGALITRSLGVAGTTTQEPGGDLESDVAGKVGTIRIAGDVVGAFINVTGGPSGDIGSVTIGGNLVGATLPNSGSIVASGDIGPVRIGASVVGGGAPGATDSGRIDSGGNIASVTIVANLIGSAASGSGSIQADGNLGPVRIGVNVIGGAGSDSGSIETEMGGNIASVTILGSLVGGGGSNSGKIQTESGGSIGPVKIGTPGGGSGLIGGTGGEAGAIEVDDGGSIASVTIFGNMIGGAGSDSASIQVDDAGNIGPVRILGSMVGSAGQGSGSILIADNGSIASVTITGAMIGSAGDDSGSIQTSDLGNVGPVRIGTAMIGSAGASSGSIQAPRGAIASVTVGGPLIGSAGGLSGLIRASHDVGPVKLLGDSGSLVGGPGSQSGSIISTNGDLVSVAIGGAVIGGSGTAIDSGTLQAMKGTIRIASIAKDFIGGTTGGGEIGIRTGAILGQNIGTVRIGGNAVAGNNGGILLIDSGVIAAGHSIKSVVIAGNVSGSGTNRFIIQARGQLAPAGPVDLAIGSVSIGGTAQLLDILGGFAFGSPTNPDAQLGTVRVGGDWVASNVAAGVNRGDAFYGNLGDASFLLPESDTAIISRIGSIVIAGNVFGTPAPGDVFGFVAESVGTVRINGSLVVLTPGASTDILPVSAGASTGDVNVLEVI